MKKIISILLASVMTFSLVACGGNETVPETVIETADEKLTLDEGQKQLIINSINAKFESEEFVEWSELYTEFTGNTPKTPKVTHITHYTIDDFEGAKMNCYMVNIAADVAYWVNKDAEQGAVEESFRLFIDCSTQTTYDNITTNAGNVETDTSTDEGRATYLLWIYGESINNQRTEEHYLNETETVSVIFEEDVEAINNTMNLPFLQEAVDDSGLYTYTAFGDVTVHSFKSSVLDNGNTQFTLEYTAPAEREFSIFNPPEGKLFLHVSDQLTTGEKDTLIFEVEKAHLEQISEIVVNFDFENAVDNILIHINE